jgi:phenylacetate-CoA ligase
LRLRGFSRLAVLLRDQWRSPDELARLRDRRLSAMVRRAAEEVPALRERLQAAGINPCEIRSAADLSRVPVVGKGYVAGLARERALSSRVDKARLVKDATSGSSGNPLEVFLTPADSSVAGMAWVRAMLAHGMRPWDRRLEISGPHNIQGRARWYHRFGLWTWSGVSAFEGPDAWLCAWRQARADVLWGYTGSLHILANHLLERGVEDVRPRLVFGVSDSVDPAARVAVREAFGTRLIDLYGAAESGLIAWECPVCEAYHLNSDLVVTELLRDGSAVAAGETGSVIVTRLFSRAMPFLRYDVGDLAVASDARPSCGRGLPLLREVQGRNDDRLLLPSGRVLSPMFAFGAMKPVSGVRQWRVHQERSGRIVILVVPGPAFGAEGSEGVRRRWQECLGESPPLEVRVVDRIAPLPSGKIKAVFSETPASASSSL